jgi:hypothetical protein
MAIHLHQLAGVQLNYDITWLLCVFFFFVQLPRKILPCIKRTVTFVLARGAMGFLPGVQRGEVGRQRVHAHNKALSCVNQRADATILFRKNSSGGPPECGCGIVVDRLLSIGVARARSEGPTCLPLCSAITNTFHTRVRRALQFIFPFQRFAQLPERRSMVITTVAAKLRPAFILPNFWRPINHSPIPMIMVRRVQGSACGYGARREITRKPGPAGSVAITTRVTIERFLSSPPYSHLHQTTVCSPVFGL